MLYDPAYRVFPQRVPEEQWADDPLCIEGSSHKDIEENLIEVCGQLPLERCPPIALCNYYWPNAKERFLTRFNGWYTGIGGKLYNLYRSPASVRGADFRASILGGMASTLNKDFSCAAAHQAGFAAHVVDEHLPLCRLAFLTYQYTLADRGPVLDPNAALENLIFETLNPYWPEIERRWDIEAQRNPRSSRYLGER